MQKKLSRLENFAPDQLRKIQYLHAQVVIVRVTQLIFIVWFGADAIFSDGGRAVIILGIVMVSWLQTQLPVLPPWLEKYRPKD